MEKLLRFLFKASVVLIAITVIVPVIWYKNNYPTYSWNQKMTVEVQTPDGVVSGSSVTSIEWSRNFFSGGWGGAAWHTKVQGESIVVNLRDDRYLFALLSNLNDYEYTSDLASQTLYDTKEWIRGKEAFRRVQKLKTSLIVPQKLYPFLVTFTDNNDPSTVKMVDPHDLAASFGDGYSLKSITLEITDDPVTWGRAEKMLGWLDEYKINFYMLNGRRCIACPVASENLSDLLSAGNFKVGE